MKSSLKKPARRIVCVVLTAFISLAAPCLTSNGAETYEGQFFRGEGNVGYLELLDISRRLMEADAELPNLPMLYTPAWNGFVEGPTWGAWWIQNSYGTTYCALPILQEPFVTFLQNSQDLWFDQMGDGKRAGANQWVAPDGCLCDAASPNWIVYKQGDGRTDIHDWGVEFTAAGLLLQSELLLIGHDIDAVRHYLPRLERCARFVESRRDPEKNLFKAGPAGNLLAPSYAGFRRPDGTFDMAYLVGLGVTYIAALDRLVELETMVGASEKAKEYAKQRDLAKAGLAHVTTEEGYFLKSLDPDGTKHGAYGAAKHGYLEAVPNHDAVCFRVVGDDQARKIMDKMRSVPGLRPHDLIITNYPSLDDMYVEPDSWLWKFGTWVNGGHWTTCEGRMIMAYYRTGCFDDAARAMRQILKFARDFRMDNPLVDFGNAVYQPHEPINLCYDNFAAPAAMVRGLFELLYHSDRLTLVPHIPPDITRLQQDFPVRFGNKRIYLATIGTGPITAVTLNDQPWARHDGTTVELPYDEIPDESRVTITLGAARDATPWPMRPAEESTDLPARNKKAELLLFPVISRNDLPLRIGADSDGRNCYVGEIARVRLHARALPAQEIEAAAADPSAVLAGDTALIADWRMSQHDGGTVPNSAGGQLPAKTVGEVEWTDGPSGKVLRLKGKGYLEVAPDSRLDFTTELTLEAWVRTETLPAGGARIVDKSKVGTSNGYLLDTHPGNSLRLIVERGSLGHDASAATNQWCYVAATADRNGNLSLWMNGKRVATASHGSADEIDRLETQSRRLLAFSQQLQEAGLNGTYEASHARLAVRCYAVAQQRLCALADGRIARLNDVSQRAADKAYFATASKLCDGFEKLMAVYEKSDIARNRRIFSLWSQEDVAHQPAAEQPPGK